MTKQELKNLLILIRNGAFITPILERIWKEINKKDKDDKDTLSI